MLDNEHFHEYIKCLRVMSVVKIGEAKTKP